MNFHLTFHVHRLTIFFMFVEIPHLADGKVCSPKVRFISDLNRITIFFRRNKILLLISYGNLTEIITKVKTRNNAVALEFLK